MMFTEVFEGENPGFDIVIGNPPYLRIQGIRESNPVLAEILSKQFESATGSFDLYVTFAEKGMNLINTIENNAVKISLALDKSVWSLFFAK